MTYLSRPSADLPVFEADAGFRNNVLYLLQKIKRSKVIRTITLSSVAPRIYLESEEEVEKYVNMLKEKLLSVLKENVRIRVEF